MNNIKIIVLVGLFFCFYEEFALSGDRLFIEHFPETQYHQKIIEHLSMLNQDPLVLYRDDAHKQNPDLINQFIQGLASIGFESQSLNDITLFVYQGKKASLGLMQFAHLRPLILDCRPALYLAAHLALLDVLGEHGYNDYLEKAYKGTLAIGDNIFNKRNNYYRPNFKLGLHKNALNDIQVGDLVFILGPKNGFAYKPTSALNAFNLICTKIIEGVHYFKGFGSFVDHEMTYDEYKELMLKSSTEPLTYNDLFYIYVKSESFPHEKSIFSDVTWEEVADFLSMNYGISWKKQALLGKYLLTLESNKVWDASDIILPRELQSDDIVGLVVIQKLDILIQKSNKVHIDSSNFGEIANDVLNLDFILDTPEQKRMYGAIHAFYESVILHKDNPKALGLILFGAAGMGKTHLCTKIIKKLQQNGLQVWQQDFNKEKISNLEFASAYGGNFADYQRAMQRVQDLFNEAWANTDVFYFDDVNEGYGKHALITAAAIAYARQHKKAVLITSNHSPFDVLEEKALNQLGDFLEIVQVHGQDFRKNQCWWDKELPLYQDLPTNFSSGDALTSQQQEIIAWVNKLDQVAPSKEQISGLAIYGVPGIGKSSAVRLALENKNTFWLDGRNITYLKDIKKTIAESFFDYLIVDDVNDAFLKEGYQDLMMQLLNMEQLINAAGKDVKVIIISNRVDDPTAFIEDSLQTKSDFLKMRMQSRFASSYYVLPLKEAKDFRKNLPDTLRPGVIVTQSNATQRDLFFGYAEKEVALVDMAKFNQTLERAFQQKNWQVQNDYRQNLENLMTQRSVIVVFWNEEPNFSFEKRELESILDHLANHKKVIFVTPLKGTIFIEYLETLLKKSYDQTGKYLSRLNLLRSAE